MSLANKFLARGQEAGPGRAFSAGLRLAGLGVLLLAGCRARTAPDDVREHVVLAEDFEQFDGWLPDAEPSLTTERAHSGRYSVKVDKEHAFSITYHLELGKAFALRPRRMRLSAWVWVESAAEDAQIVFAINQPFIPDSPPLFRTSLYLADQWPYRRWTHVSRDIVLPPGLSSHSKLMVYLWHNAAQNAVFTDDWTLTEIH